VVQTSCTSHTTALCEEIKSCPPYQRLVLMCVSQLQHGKFLVCSSQQALWVQYDSIQINCNLLMFSVTNT